MQQSSDLGVGGYGSFCFLCHRTLVSGGRRRAAGEQIDGTVATEEDVIPKWLMRRFNLGDATASMPNGQLQGYGRRKVPCCFECNQRMSTELERPVATAVTAGVDAVRSLDPGTLLMWLAKLYYGTKFYETRFLQDAADSTSALILEHSDLLERNDYLRRLLLTIPKNVQLVTPPASVFVFRAGVPGRKDARFDFFVSGLANVDMISVRMGDVFVAATFGDNGHWVSRFGGVRLVEYALSEMTLHPAQCTEVTAWLASLLAGHEASGPWDFLTAAGGTSMEVATVPSRSCVSVIPGPRVKTIFRSNFVVTANDAPDGSIRLLRVGTLFDRLGHKLTREELRQVEEGDWVPTLLLNVRTDIPVQASCFEPWCPDLFRRADWIVDLSSCPKCGAESGLG